MFSNLKNNACYSFCQDKATNTFGGRRKDQEPMAVDTDLVVQDLNRLTAEERERISEEVHGLAAVIDETPEFVSQSLHKMREQVLQIPKKNKKAWERAIYLRPSLVNDDKLHMMFLRAERFDPVNAAAKLCRFYEHKLELFGDSKLVKRITLDDLDEPTLSLFQTGSVQFLTSNDRCGRGVYFMTVASYDIRDVNAMLRCGWYTIVSALEQNEEIQKRGVVQVVNLIGPWRYPPLQILEAVRPYQQILQDWPFRSCGLHLCYDNAVIRSVLNALNAISGRELRIRERTHFGSVLEIQYSLLTFGISLPDAFAPGKGIMSRENIDNYLCQRRQIDEEWTRQEQNHRDANRELAEYPTHVDVLMGRGQTSRSWIGNQLFWNMSLEYADRYNLLQQKRFDKTMLSIEVVQRIQVLGGRFIERTDEGWMTVPDQVAKDKVSQVLRTQGRKRVRSSTASAFVSSRPGK